MQTHTTNYYDTFIEIAEDSAAASGTVPPLKKNGPSVANIQYDLISQHPYKYTSDDILFQVYALRNDLNADELAAARAQFFSKGQPCMRASPLTKTYGWGIHCNEVGKIALYGRETEAYEAFQQEAKLKKVKAMRSKKA